MGNGYFDFEEALQIAGKKTRRDGIYLLDVGCLESHVG